MPAARGDFKGPVKSPPSLTRMPLGIHNEEGLTALLSNCAVSKVASSTPLPLLLIRESKGRARNKKLRSSQPSAER
jgi:hypothetical protein